MTAELNEVAKADLINLDQQRAAFMARARNFDPKAAAEHARSGDSMLPDEAIEHLCKPCRIVIDFRDPVHVRRQIETLQGHLARALVITQDHDRGENNQRLDLRNVIKQAADALVYMNGKTPTNKKPLTKLR